MPPILIMSAVAANPSASIERSSSAQGRDLNSAAASGTSESDQGSGARQGRHSRPGTRKRSRSGTSPPRVTWSEQLRAYVQASQRFASKPWKEVVAQAQTQGLLPSGPPSWAEKYAKNIRTYYHNHLKVVNTVDEFEVEP